MFHVSPLASGGLLATFGIPRPVGTSLLAQLVKNPPATRETWVPSMGWEDLLEKGTDTYPFQYSGLENSMDCIVHGVTKSWTQLSDFFQFHHKIVGDTVY